MLLVAADAAFPSQARIGNRLLVLNGAGERTYSWLNVVIYRAALYLETRSDDAARILDSPSVKMVDVRYLRDGDRALVTRAWEESFRDNCGCALPPAFRARLTDIRAGDEERYVFFPDRTEIAVNGGVPVAVGGASRVILSTFIGARPPTESLKAALLGRR